ncbi:MAG: hypothetical protein EOM68_07455 [Spirochaetia bacterium]|nr:hypothetical protein [Spirochaetia bacterium]
MAKLVKTGETTTTKKATTQMPQVEQAQFTPSYTPFRYEPGQSINDVILQGRQQDKVLQDQEQRSERNAKIMAFSNFMNALGSLAGMGRAPEQQRQPPAYLQQSFAMADQARRERMQSQAYYNDLERKTRQTEYDTQFKYHNEREKDKNKYGYEQAKMNADQRFKANLEQYKSGLNQVVEKWEDPTERNARISQGERRTKAAESNAESSRIRAEKAGTSQRPFLQHKDPRTGEMRTMNKSAAQMVINRLQERAMAIQDKPEAILTPIEKAIRNDIALYTSALQSADPQRSDNTISQIVLKYLDRDTQGEFSGLFDQAQPTQRGSLIQDLLDSDTNNTTPTLLR